MRKFGGCQKTYSCHQHHIKSAQNLLQARVGAQNQTHPGTSSWLNNVVLESVEAASGVFLSPYWQCCSCRQISFRELKQTQATTLEDSYDVIYERRFTDENQKAGQGHGQGRACVAQSHGTVSLSTIPNFLIRKKILFLLVIFSKIKKNI